MHMILQLWMIMYFYNTYGLYTSYLIMKQYTARIL